MNNERKTFQCSFESMGTNIVIDAYASAGKDEVVKKVFRKAKEIFQENEKIFSRFDKSSELSKLNSCLGERREVSFKMAEVIELAGMYWKNTEGYFDPRIIEKLESIGYRDDFHSQYPSLSKSIHSINALNGDYNFDVNFDSKDRFLVLRKRIDLSGIVKGYTIKEVSNVFLQSGFSNFIINAGGDLFAAGVGKDNYGWQIEVEGIESLGPIFRIENLGMATSGISRKRWRISDKKYHHLINPKELENFESTMKSVSVIADDVIEADVLAKVVFLMGKESGLQYCNANNIKVAFLDYRNNIYLSNEIKKNTI